MQQEAMQEQQQHVLNQQKEFKGKVSNLEEKIPLFMSSASTGLGSTASKQKTNIT